MRLAIDEVLTRRIEAFDAGWLHGVTRRRRPRLPYRATPTVLPWDRPYHDAQERHYFCQGLPRVPSTDYLPPPIAPTPAAAPSEIDLADFVAGAAGRRSAKTGLTYPIWWQRDVAKLMLWYSENQRLDYAVQRFEQYERENPT